MKTKVFQIAILLSSLLLMACHKDVVYSEFREIENVKWHQDSVMRYEFEITDTLSEYTLLLYVRHTETYPYQNMWLFVGDAAKEDTIEFFLADDRGRWLGNGKNGLIEMPVLYEQHFRFAHNGLYQLTVRQGMRDSLLRGISDVGLVVKKEFGNGQE